NQPIIIIDDPIPVNSIIDGVPPLYINKGKRKVEPDAKGKKSKKLKPNTLDDSEFTNNLESEKSGDSGLEFDISSLYKSSTNIEEDFLNEIDDSQITLSDINIIQTNSSDNNMGPSQDKTKKYFDIQIEGNPKPITIAFEEYSLPITNIANSYFEEEVDIKYQIRNICRKISDNKINYNNSRVQYIYSLCELARISYELTRK
ncbi:16842_t:CDS:2, partial [Gigaspora margarita]